MTRRIALALGGLLALGGCGRPTQQLNGNAFYPQQQPLIGPHNGVGPVDRSGSIIATAQPKSGEQQVEPAQISDTVADSVHRFRPPARPLVWAPSTAPATRPTTLPTGQYLIVGAAVAEVDGMPIYSSDVLAPLYKEFAVRAREKDMDENSFRVFAHDEIEKTVWTKIHDQVEYAAAERSIDKSDRDFVDHLTTEWRTSEINKAGGSVEQVIRNYKAEGSDFDKAVEDKHREYMTQMYYERKVFPLIVVTADMMRDYYQRNKDKFSQKSQAQFRMIRIDSAERGDRNRALAEAQDVQKKAASGVDFIQLAREHNHDKYLSDNAGMPMNGAIERGAFAIKPVEDAAWKLQPGQVSPVVTVGDVFYIVKLESKTEGSVQPFDSEPVQDRIREALRRQQFAALREQKQKALEKEAIIRFDPTVQSLLLEMVMQQYAQWHSAPG